MKKYGLLILLIGTGVMIAVMSTTGSTLKTPSTPKGIVDLEFAYNTSKTARVITAWAGEKISAAKTNTYLDFIFLCFYSLFLFFSAKKIARISSGVFSDVGRWLAKGALLAGFSDALENTGMLLTLAGNSSATIAFLTTAASVIKWTLVLLAVVYCLVGVLYIISQKKWGLLLG